MVRNYLKTAIRSLFKNKVFSFINISGLAIGLGAFLLIFQFITFEQSFDNFHEDADNLYRVQFERIYSDRHDKSAGLTAGAGQALKDEFPEVVNYTKIHSAGYMTNTLSINGSKFIEKDIFYADHSFFDLFSFELKIGDGNSALAEMNSIVISEERALSYFGKTDVIGEIIEVENGWGIQQCKVTAVFNELPSNTHFQFDVLISLETLHKLSGGQSDRSFGWNAFPTYLKLAEGANYQKLEAKFPEFAQRNYTSIIERGVKPVLKLQPLQDIYLHSNLRFEVGPLGNFRVVKILTGISIFIVVLAYFNYINLSTSKSMERAKEIGVRKVSGANRLNLLIQFMCEAFLLNFLSIVLGFTLMQLTLPFFESALGKSFGEFSTIKTQLFTLVVIMITAGTLLSGFYPAWIMSKMNATKVLKGQKIKSGSDGLVRKGLVVLQFTILCFLLIGSLAVRSQIKYMLTSDRGFNSEQMIVVNGPASGNNSASLIKSFKAGLLAHPEVMGVSNSTMIPGGEISWVNNNVRLATANEDEIVSIPFLGVDDRFVDNLSLKVIAGRNFNAELKSDTASVMFSRAGARAFGITNPEDAVGIKILDGGVEFLVVGVVEDYLQKSFKTGYDPIIYRHLPEANNYMIIKSMSDDYELLLDKLESTYSAIYPTDTFNYFFLDEFFERQFEEDRRFGTVFNFFTLLGIWISCLGLFGLVSYSVIQRSKEIGIRKVLGASILGIINLISKRFIGMIFLSILISIPISYYATKQWLSGYSFATELSLMVFVFPVAIILIITLVTTGSLAFKSASRNPVDSLRYE